MIVLCPTCLARFDDEFRNTNCPHETFSANNGKNEFAHHPKSYLSTDPTTHEGYEAPPHNANT